MSTQKIIATFSNTKHVTVTWCKTWEEYQVKCYGVNAGTRGKLIDTYNTDDKEDAIETAKRMSFYSESMV